MWGDPVYQGLCSKSMQHKKFNPTQPIQKNGINIMVLNSKIKHKLKTVLGVIRNLVLEFILYSVNSYMKKYPIHVTLAQK